MLRFVIPTLFCSALLGCVSLPQTVNSVEPPITEINCFELPAPRLPLGNGEDFRGIRKAALIGFIITLRPEVKEKALRAISRHPYINGVLLEELLKIVANDVCPETFQRLKNWRDMYLILKSGPT